MDESDRTAISEVNKVFTEAFGRGDFDAVGACYAENARLMPPGLPTVVGREGISRFWAGGAKTLGIVKLTLTTRELEGDGGTARELGQYEAFGPEKLLDRGSYLVVWKKASEGSWRLNWDIWNSDGDLGG